MLDRVLHCELSSDGDEDEEGTMRPKIIPIVTIPTIPTIMPRGESDIDDNAKVKQDFLYSFPSFRSAVLLLLSMLSLSLF